MNQRGKNWRRNIQRRTKVESRMGVAYLLYTAQRLGFLVAHLQRRLHALKRRSATQHRAIVRLRDERDAVRAELSRLRAITNNWEQI